MRKVYQSFRIIESIYYKHYEQFSVVTFNKYPPKSWSITKNNFWAIETENFYAKSLNDFHNMINFYLYKKSMQNTRRNQVYLSSSNVLPDTIVIIKE